MDIKVGDKLKWMHCTGGLFTQNKIYEVIDTNGDDYVVILDDDGDRYSTDGRNGNWEHLPSKLNARILEQKSGGNDKEERIARLSSTLIELTKLHANSDIQIRTDLALSIEAISEMIVRVANEEE